MSLSLETNNYIASSADISAITRAVLDAQRSGSHGRTSYLKAFVATTLHELETHTKPDKRGRDVQLTAAEKVHARFYEIVMRTVNESLVRDRVSKRREAMERNRRSNFARSARSTLVAWVRAGGDITKLNPSEVTKRSLHVESRKRRVPSIRVLSNQSAKFSEQLEKTARKLATVDKETAVEVIDSMVAKLSSLRDQINIRA